MRQGLFCVQRMEDTATNLIKPVMKMNSPPSIFKHRREPIQKLCPIKSTGRRWRWWATPDDPVARAGFDQGRGELQKDVYQPATNQSLGWGENLGHEVRGSGAKYSDRDQPAIRELEPVWAVLGVHKRQSVSLACVDAENRPQAVLAVNCNKEDQPHHRQIETDAIDAPPTTTQDPGFSGKQSFSWVDPASPSTGASSTWIVTDVLALSVACTIPIKLFFLDTAATSAITREGVGWGLKTLFGYSTDPGTSGVQIRSSPNGS
ncbi:hypothetical protein BJ322DRAFT_1025392 [Thelephora terrestris]|uniref:Uncharacterized protein n=1 Tax=Thelephora terrestris TaxID=56493 RepID=A0A9P6L150_9AGAM|nr:hypothetical protein BJ322DRAFT_1025392 [Thelephora terrestris]